MIPRATYRLQFHRDFPFARGAELAGYLSGLGVSHIYASPIATARAGSRHGYDVVDPTRTNPELGGEAGFREMAAALRAEGLGLILDIVPNHMAVGQGDNAWWLDVLENGRASRYAEFFDIDWEPGDPALHGKIAAPFLGKPYAQALEAGDITLRADAVKGGVQAVAHGVHVLPIRPEDHFDLLAEGLDRYDGRDAAGRTRLHALLDRQHFRLAWWRTANDEINWRRFFDITELAGLRVEREEVFEAVHTLPLQLYAEGLIDGVRVDHVDGLADPAGYCRRLRDALAATETKRPAGATSGPAYLVVEKILGDGEALPEGWGVDGTTGYDFMNEVSALLHDCAGEAAFTARWAQLSGRSPSFAFEERLARLEIVSRSFGAQLEAVVRAFSKLARSDLMSRDISAGALRRALVLLLAAFPTYRTYRPDTLRAADRRVLDQALLQAQPHCAPGEYPVLEQVVAWLAGHGPGAAALRDDAARRFQQLSAPISAKAVEDTAFYRYGRLLSRNDVGFDPGRFTVDVSAAHEANRVRCETYPHAMLTTATHDHKRGEDVRARLAALSSLDRPWFAAVERWRALNSGPDAIDPADEYSLYQTLIGAWPLDLAPTDLGGLQRFKERVSRWQEKALREAKLRSSWSEPDLAYEQRCEDFLARCLDPSRSFAFLQDAHGFVAQIAPAGALNSLAQTLIRCTAPGMPDLYQGGEGWDLSLVDPDNRSPIDYQSRRAALRRAGAPTDLLRDWRSGAVKQALIRTALDVRKRRPALFSQGTYVPLQAEGERSAQVFSFARTLGTATAIVVAPIRCAGALLETGEPMPPPSFWGDTWIDTHAKRRGGLAVDLLSGQEFTAPAAVSDLLAIFPVALLLFET